GGGVLLWCLLAPSIAAAGTTLPPPIPGELRVATWNIRSGEGRCPIALACPFTDSTANCANTSAPLNAWGHGIPQAELLALNKDPTLVAIGIQEGWGCGTPAAVKGVLGWPFASASFNGTALIARFGISGEVQSTVVSPDGLEPEYVIGADVCVDAHCSATVRVYVAHLSYAAATDAEA